VKQSKEPTLKEFCMEQLGRMNKTYGYPDNRLAVDDYCAALAVMASMEGVKALMDDLARTEFIHMPSAASIRHMAWERTEAARQKKAKCGLCGGTGVETVFYLASYEGRNWSAIRKVERIHKGQYYSEYEASVELRKTLAAAYASEAPPTVQQQVISAAKDCACVKRA